MSAITRSSQSYFLINVFLGEREFPPQPSQVPIKEHRKRLGRSDQLPWLK